MVRYPQGKPDGEHRITQTTMAHIFRGELARSDTWRTRLDTTTNWALTTTAAVISFAFASATTPHGILIVGLWMVLSFLSIEARRYRYYDIWIRRVRLIEDGYWSPLIRQEPVDPDALRELAHDMSRPLIRLSLLSALATRINRSYGPILLVLSLTWFVKVQIHPIQAPTFRAFFANAWIGPVHGAVVTAAMVIFTVAVILLFVYALIASPPLGELRVRPSSHRAALWERFLRPYAVPRVRKRGRRVPLRAGEPKSP